MKKQKKKAEEYAEANKSVYQEQLEIIHNKLYDLISDLEYLSEMHYWGDGDYCETKKCFDRALALISLKLEKENEK